MPTSSTSSRSTSSRRVAVVTGSSKGLGRGMAVSLAGSGCDVVVNYATDEVGAKETAALVEQAGGRAAVVPGDVRQPATADALVAAAADLGGLDVWVNNAGVSVLAPVIDTEPADLVRMVDVNLMGTFHGLRAAAHHMVAAGTGGRIVNVASEVAVQAFPLLGAYGATKFAVVGLTQAAALELAADGITVNAVGPGTAETDMVLAERRSEVAITGREPDDVRAAYLDGIPAGRFCDPADAGALVAWLAGPDASYVTGQTFLVNGGSVLH
jgi:meso-butanediol dehydrogenase / (S,S)-butanediol dehydrogenase / diacetyl reductase